MKLLFSYSPFTLESPFFSVFVTTSTSKSHSLFSSSEIDKTLESMSSYRKNKWIVEGRLRR